MAEGSLQWVRDSHSEIFRKIDELKSDLGNTKTKVEVMEANHESAAVRNEQKLGEIKTILEKLTAKSSTKPPNIGNQIVSFLFSTKGVAIVITALILLFMNGELGTVLSKLLDK